MTFSPENLEIWVSWREYSHPIQAATYPPFTKGTYILSRPGLVRYVNQLQLPIDVHRPGGCPPCGRGQLDPTHHLLGQLRPLGPLPRGPLGV